MNYRQKLPLSPELEKYREQIEATIKPYIEIEIENNEQVDWWQSKFGGLPYLPKGFNYPKAADGTYLFLLAQINFAEVPPLECFPTQGMLQFYIGDNELLGADYKDPSHSDDGSYRIVYFPQVERNLDNIITNYDFLPQPEYFPIYGCCSLQFTKKYAPISVDDYQFEKVLGEELSNFIYSSNKIEEEYCDIFSSWGGHKIGGYPSFVQGDIRFDDTDTNDDADILLFQMNSDDNKAVHIGWGDGGIANFFILESQLKNLDFSQVFYYWACY